jgi:hypothetical protein
MRNPICSDLCTVMATILSVGDRLDDDKFEFGNLDGQDIKACGWLGRFLKSVYLHAVCECIF